MKLNKNKVLILLAEKDLNQGDLALIASMSRSTVNALVNGKSGSMKSIVRIAKGLNVNVMDIIEE
ncbi:helix-turn-helix transcriptional regulator [Acetobacterium sp.]|uniref:helix-turn-helix transcriptional regulator n=1 Tax=Acetobacterium sp. TaxID=1872094 RepID=UPI0027275B82|nr:helix-turn-helix domain-containing protein [Acetobacterium sp.]MDO9492480.1 helix-turn-helix domain-containing protein [Acetobacterium sp.]